MIHHGNLLNHKRVFKFYSVVFSSCFGNDTGNGDNGRGKTYTMTAKEHHDDLIVDSDFTTYMNSDFKSLDYGDTIIIHDNLTEVIYGSASDITYKRFITTEKE